MAAERNLTPRAAVQAHCRGALRAPVRQGLGSHRQPLQELPARQRAVPLEVQRPRLTHLPSVAAVYDRRWGNDPALIETPLEVKTAC